MARKRNNAPNAYYGIRKVMKNIGDRMSFADFEAPAARSAFSMCKKRNPGFNYKSKRNHLDCVVFTCTGIPDSWNIANGNED